MYYMMISLSDWLYLFVIVLFLCNICDGDESLTEVVETDEESALWLEEESPPWYIDLMFTFVITVCHLWYACQFTDYSLRHISSQKDDDDEEDVCNIFYYLLRFCIK